MATKTLNTRITLKADTTANWAASTLVLLKGEQAFEITESGAWKAKVGDGVNTFKDLSYITMTPEEISSLIASGAIQTISLASGTNNGTLKLTVDGVTTDNIAVKGLGTAAYTNAGAYATAAQGTLATNAVRKVATGTANGTISVTTGTGAATNVAVKGLGSAAYTASSAYATAAQGTKADNAMPKGGGTFTGAVTLAADPTADLQPTTKQYVDSKISSSIAASDAMVFKGTLGTNGTATALPASSVVVGDTYKVITQVTVPKTNSYTGADVVAKIGDLVVAMSKDPKWIVVPSGDEIVTTVKYSTTTQNLTTNAQSGAITVGEAATKQVDTSITSGTTSTKLPTSKAVADYVTWGNVAGKPSTFTPSAHTHTKGQVGLGNVDNTADKDKSVKYATSAGTAANVIGGAVTTTNEAYRHIWFSDYGTETKRAYDDAFKYDPKSNTVTANISGNAASASSVNWSNVKNKPSTYTPSAHTHTIANITGLQGQLDTRALSKTLSSEDLNTIVTPGFYTAGGGNTCTNKPSNVDNFGLIVTHNATGSYYTQIIFKTTDNISYRRYCNNGTWSAWVQDRLTDTNTWRPVVNNLTSDATDQSLSAAQGKALKTLVDGKAAAGHTHSSFSGEIHFSVGGYKDPANGISTAIKASGGIAADVFYEGTTKLSDKYQPKGSYAAASHTHTIAQITNLQSTLDGKSNNGHVHNYAGSSSAGGSANSAVKLATARNFSISGGATAAAVSFNGTGNATLSVTSLNTDYLNNGSNTLILACGGA